MCRHLDKNCMCGQSEKTHFCFSIFVMFGWIASIDIECDCSDLRSSSFGFHQYMDPDISHCTTADNRVVGIWLW